LAISQGDHPRDLIHTIAEDMLTRFDAAPLVDKYEAYQRLMSYWAATMQDDVFIIAGGGWLAARELREARKETTDDGRVKWLEEGDLTVNKVRLVADVIPPRLLTARFFAGLKAALDQATARAEELGREIEELAEEHGAEGGLFEELMADSGKLTAGGVKARLKDRGLEPDEKALLKQVAALFENEAEAKRAAKEAEARLTEAVLKKYPALTMGEIQTLVVQDKWLADITAVLGAEVEARTESLTARVRVLTERYGQMGDGVALFNAGHGNLGTAGAISETTLAEAYRLFGNQRGLEPWRQSFAAARARRRGRFRGWLAFRCSC